MGTFRFRLVLVLTFVALALSPAKSQAGLYPYLPPTLKEVAPEAYAQMRPTAEARLAAGDFEGAAALLSRMTGAYPYDGGVWRELGRAELARGRFREAAADFEAAHRLGLSDSADDNAADAARAYARLGAVAQTVRWLRVAIESETYREPQALLAEADFDRVRGDPQFRRLAARYEAHARRKDRTGRLTADLEVFLDAFRRYRQDVTPEARQRVFRAAQDLTTRLPRLSDGEVIAELQRLSALAPGGHNTAPALETGVGVDGRPLRQLPIDLYAFPDGLYVIGGAPNLDPSLVGARVTAFGSIPAEEMLRRAAALVDRDPGSDPRVVAIAPRYLTLLPVLHDLGATDTDAQARLTVQVAGRPPRQVLLTGGAYRPRAKLYPPPGARRPPPLALQHIDQAFWFTDLEPGVVYVQFNKVEPNGRESISAFAARLRAHLETSQADTLIVDARFNGGGDTFTYVDLLRTLVSFDLTEGHRLFYIEGRETFSAAINFSTDVRRLTHAVFVGEPATAPRAAGDPAFITLPNTGLQVKFSTNTWSLYYPDDTRAWIAPDVPVQLTAADHFAGRDTVLDTVRAIIRAARAVPTPRS